MSGLRRWGTTIWAPVDTFFAAGCGIAQLPTWLIQSQLEEETLVEVLPQLATDGLAINLAWVKSRQVLPKIQALLNVLADCLTPSGRKGR
ncbi:LysR substrate-binding domain-containing protein [Pseudomonas sp. PB120]|uniref:LysR substrate-binding domain-containing protein n=1 Tax=Pseudomonas sp. PB120 TaxID=2494700 RepID=UPI00211577B6|nr:LysR substrate-binding domain-containing protein [Pseudomonas sp. PB120]